MSLPSSPTLTRSLIAAVARERGLTISFAPETAWRLDYLSDLIGTDFDYNMRESFLLEQRLFRRLSQSFSRLQSSKSRRRHHHHLRSPPDIPLRSPPLPPYRTTTPRIADQARRNNRSGLAKCWVVLLSLASLMSETRTCLRTPSAQPREYSAEHGTPSDLHHGTSPRLLSNGKQGSRLRAHAVPVIGHAQVISTRCS